jgi:hypothetical protein
MYKLGLCELHSLRMHGGDPKLGHYLLISTYLDLHSPDDDEYENESDLDSDSDSEPDNVFEDAKLHNEFYQGMENTFHPFIRNYHKIVKRPNYIKPEIMQVIILETGEHVCILKTCWLRIFQRMWRRKYAKFLSIIKNIDNINMSRLTGKLKKR